MSVIGYHETIGPMKESAVWVEEAPLQTLAWGRRSLSPTSYQQEDPLGISVEENEYAFLFRNYFYSITLGNFVTVMFYKLKESVCNTVHHFLEYMGSAFKEFFLIVNL